MRSIQVVLALSMTIGAAAAAAQTPPSPEMPPVAWTHGPEIDVHVGAANSASTTGGVLGGAVQWDMTPRLAVEGRGSWFQRGSDAQGFSVDATALLNLVRKQTATPYVGVGFAIYRASFGSTAVLPAFYRDRLPASPVGTTSAFTDPALRLSAGVDIGGLPSGSHWLLRPEVAMLLIFANGTSETMVAGTVSVGYQFHASPRGEVR